MDNKKKFGLFRYLVPGFLFQSVVIGGGYGTGNEIAQYFGIHGMGHGIIGMIITTLVWAVVAAATFEFCRTFKVYDYNNMSQKLLGPVGYLYEVCYIVLMLIVLGVINATASSMITDLTGWAGWIGIIILSLGIIYLILRGTDTIEKVLSFWSYILYAVYAVFMIMCFVKFGPQIKEAFAAGAGFIKAVDDRIEITSARNGEATPTWVRPVIAIGLTLIGVAVSTFGLTGLIAKGYGTVCWGFLIVYVIPMLTIGIYKISKAGK